MPPTLGSIASLAAGGAITQTGPGSPNIPNDPILANGPRAQQAAVPFWDNFGGLPEGPQGPTTSNNSFNPWDVCMLGGLVLPGLAKVDVKSRKRFDVKKSKGKDGATLTFTGYDPSEITIELRIWTQVQLDTLQSIMGMLRPRAIGSPGSSLTTIAAAAAAGAAAGGGGLAAAALDINHPATTLLGIHSVYVADVGGLRRSEERGVMQMEIRCLEFVPQGKGDNTGTVDSSKDFHNATAINVTKSSRVPMPSQDPTYCGPGPTSH